MVESDSRASLTKICLGFLQGLIGGIYLLLQFVQLCIPVEFPPVSTKRWSTVVFSCPLALKVYAWRYICKSKGASDAKCVGKGLMVILLGQLGERI